MVDNFYKLVSSSSPVEEIRVFVQNERRSDWYQMNAQVNMQNFYSKRTKTKILFLDGIFLLKSF